MSELRIRLDIPFSDLKLHKNGVLANIYEIEAQSKSSALTTAEKKRLRRLVIPAGQPGDVAFYTVAIPPGRYLVEALLPSGLTIRDDVTIAGAEEVVDLRLQADESQHEWLSLQHFVGNVGSREEHLERAKRINFIQPRPPLRVDHLTMPGVGAVNDSRFDLVDHASRGYFFLCPSFKVLPRNAPLSTALSFYDPSKSPLVREALSPVFHDPETAVFRWQTIDDPRLKDYCWAEFPRYFVFVRGDDIPAQYMVLPHPWKQVESLEYAEVEASVQNSALIADREREIDFGFRISVAVADSQFCSIIAYLGAGNMQNAAAMLRNVALDMLMEKMANPLAAAAGAYVLLNTEEFSKSERWHEWIGNLAKWFRWLPDGAIQYGWLLLQRPQMERNINKARESLLKGFRRGIPFFSRGVGLLLDGLTLFANDARYNQIADPEVEAALKAVQKLALRTNMRQPFTSVLIR